jgi:small subunit ribosomal protein S6
MAKYELMFIIDPALSEDQRNESVNELKALFEENSVKIVKEEVIGDKKLAYKINKSDRGFYFLYDIELEGNVIKTMSPTINLNRSIWRYMFTKQA